MKLRISKPFSLALLLLLCSLGLHASELARLRNGFAIRHERREVLGEIVRLYFDAGGQSYLDVPAADIAGYEPDDSAPAPAAASPAPLSINDHVLRAGDEQQIDPDFLASVIRQESGGNPKAVSPKGARGLMQLMPRTATELGVKDSFDPGANINGGARYLRQLFDLYRGDTAKALAAYNAGPEAVDRYHGVPPFYETRTYVARVIKDYNRRKLAAAREAASQKPVATGAAHPVPAQVR